MAELVITFQPVATQDAVARVVERAESFGYRPASVRLWGQAIVVVTGNVAPDHQQKLASSSGVAQAISISTPYKLASRQLKAEETVVRAGRMTVGGSQIAVIAGPCAVENRQQTLATAEAVRAAGATGLRGGAFKPRTSPYCFQGLKEEGLRVLAAARKQTGLAVVTEVLSTDDLPLVARYADVLQVGARNMQNYRLLEAAGASGKPVLLKRGPSATLEELLLAAEYVLKTGNEQVILCERGIRSFETHTRFTLALASVPWLHERTHLPVIVDPSHGTGERSLVAPMAAAAIAAGADGLMVEVHPQPEAALCDGNQSLDFQQFRQMMQLCKSVASAVGRAIGQHAGEETGSNVTCGLAESGRGIDEYTAEEKHSGTVRSLSESSPSREAELRHEHPKFLARSSQIAAPITR